MEFFGSRTTRYPRRWSEMSREFQFLFLYHISMMGMMLLGRSLTIPIELSTASGLIVVFFMLSIGRRRALGWRWPGVGPKNLLAAVAVTVFLGVFLFAGLSFTPINANIFPWLLAALGIGGFGALQALRLVAYSEDDFLLIGRGGNVPADPKEDLLPQWKKIVRAGFRIVFLLVWLDSLASFYMFDRSWKSGSNFPTATRSEPLNNHGNIVYVTRVQKQVVDELQAAMMIGIPCVILSGLLLQFVAGVPVMKNLPTRKG